MSLKRKIHIAKFKKDRANKKLTKVAKVDETGKLLDKNYSEEEIRNLVGRVEEMYLCFEHTHVLYGFYCKNQDCKPISNFPFSSGWDIPTPVKYRCPVNLKVDQWMSGCNILNKCDIDFELLEDGDKKYLSDIYNTKLGRKHSKKIFNAKTFQQATTIHTEFIALELFSNLKIGATKIIFVGAMEPCRNYCEGSLNYFSKQNNIPITYYHVFGKLDYPK